MRASKSALALLLLCAAAAAQEEVEVGRFRLETAQPPAPWQLLRFDRHIAPTQYRVREWQGEIAVEAVANASMALLVRPLQVDLQRTPVLCWRWRVDAPLRTADMASKAGDDYAARLYLSFSLPTASLSLLTRAQLALARARYGAQVPDAALNYVWDNRYPIGTQRSNTYTERTQMWVLRSGAADAGHWVSERRDIPQDVQQAFGPIPAQLSSLALGADTDNTGEQAHAGFAQLHFVARNAPCHFTP